MRLMVSRDGYTVTGDKGLRHFGYGIASLEMKTNRENPWVVLLDKKERAVEILEQNEITKPRISLFNGWIYLIVEGIDEKFHYYCPLNEAKKEDGLDKILDQIYGSGIIRFGVMSSEKDDVEKILKFNIIL
jgi:hypothetical protein